MLLYRYFCINNSRPDKRNHPRYRHRCHRFRRYYQYHRHRYYQCHQYCYCHHCCRYLHCRSFRCCQCQWYCQSDQRSLYHNYSRNHHHCHRNAGQYSVGMVPTSKYSVITGQPALGRSPVSSQTLNFSTLAGFSNSLEGSPSWIRVITFFHKALWKLRA